MIRVTWDWLGQEPALDLANTIAVESGVERDFWGLPGKYGSWAAAETAAQGLPRDESAALRDARGEMSTVRISVRDALHAAARGDAVDASTIAALNQASSKATEWLELDASTGSLHTRRSGQPAQRLAALYARSALRLLADPDANLHVCPAPSCGMLFRPARSDQRWCSRQCGTRARVTRHLQRVRQS